MRGRGKKSRLTVLKSRATSIRMVHIAKEDSSNRTLRRDSVCEGRKRMMRKTSP
jgi:hypothetical protein